jgi:hypothetical protein
VLAALDDIVRRADAGVTVSAAAAQPSFAIGREPLRIRVKSSSAGSVYLLWGDASRLSLLFPNARDRDNRIDAERELLLPRTSWPIADGPPGTSHVVAVVSRNERDFGASGLRADAAPTPEFDLDLARRRWAPNEWSASPFVGKATCATAPCDEAYGAAMLAIVQAKAPPRPPPAAAPTPAAPRPPRTAEPESAAIAAPGVAAPPALDPKRLECEVLVRAGQKALANRSYDDAMQRAEEAQAAYANCAGAAELGRNARQAKDRARSAVVIQ